MEALLVVGLLALVGGSYHVVTLTRALTRANERNALWAGKAVPSPDRSITDDLQRQIDRLQLAVSDGIERVARAESRVSKTVTSARRLLAEGGIEHAGLEAEAEELRGRNEPTSEAEPVPELQPVLVDDRPSGIPGMTIDHLARLQRDATKQAG